MLDVEICQKKLRSFIEQVCHGQSPLYEHVCPRIADDPQVLDLMRLTPLEQPGPNLFLAAVHYLLLAGNPHELREFYGTCTERPRSAADSWPAFREFCLSHGDELAAIITTHRVQTNEVRRCSYLYPVFCFVSFCVGNRPLAIIEIGASAGLNLNWDRYAYDYGREDIIGDPNSGVVIHCEWRGEQIFLCPDMPPVGYRRGIDLHPVDLNDERQALWLQSLIWPDQPERFLLQQAAIEEFRRSPVEVIRGNALEVLPAEIEKVPTDAHLCLVHSHTLNQFSPEERVQFAELIRTAAEKRPLHVVSAEWIGTPNTELRLTSYREGKITDALLAQVDHHGRWIEWVNS